MEVTIVSESKVTVRVVSPVQGSVEYVLSDQPFLNKDRLLNTQNGEEKIKFDIEDPACQISVSKSHNSFDKTFQGEGQRDMIIQSENVLKTEEMNCSIACIDGSKDLNFIPTKVEEQEDEDLDADHIDSMPIFDKEYNEILKNSNLKNENDDSKENLKIEDTVDEICNESEFVSSKMTKEHCIDNTNNLKTENANTEDQACIEDNVVPSCDLDMKGSLNQSPDTEPVEKHEKIENAILNQVEDQNDIKKNGRNELRKSVVKNKDTKIKIEPQVEGYKIMTRKRKLNLESLNIKVGAKKGRKCSKIKKLKTHEKASIIKTELDSAENMEHVRKEEETQIDLGLDTMEDAITKKKKHVCAVCNKEFVARSSLYYHKIKDHKSTEKEEIHDCPFCEQQFPSKPKLHSHMKTHSDKPFACLICEKKFGTPYDLDFHVSSHTGKKKFFCGICNRGFLRKSRLVHHEKNHRNERDFICDKCGKGFCSDQALKVHMKRHDVSLAVDCDICKLTLSSKYALDRHMMKHSGERPWICEYCGFKTVEKNTLLEHKRRHTGDKPYTCSVCSKSFRVWRTLKRHTKTHEERKKADGRRRDPNAIYKCETCQKVFQRQAQLTRHRKTHLKQKLKHGQSSKTKKDNSRTKVLFLKVNEAAHDVSIDRNGVSHVTESEAAVENVIRNEKGASIPVSQSMEYKNETTLYMEDSIEVVNDALQVGESIEGGDDGRVVVVYYVNDVNSV